MSVSTPFVRIAIALLVGILLAGTWSIGPSLGATPTELGLLEVRSSPVVATQISVDGVARNRTELAGLPLLAGAHRVCYSAPEGYLAPPCDDVELVAGETTAVTASFVRSGKLHVVTEPVVATVLVDDVVRDDGEVRLPLAVGAHEVCFAPVAGRETPPCTTVHVRADETAAVVGRYEPTTTPKDPDPEPEDPPVVIASIAPSLAGAATSGSGNQPWSATATITVRDQDGKPASGVKVTGAWETGRAPSSSVAACVTGANGSCKVEALGMSTGAGNTATYSVDALQLHGHVDLSEQGRRSIAINRNGTVSIF